MLIDLSTAYTFHHHPALNLRPCAEGCMANEQKGNVGGALEASVFGIIQGMPGLKIGVGFNFLRYWEDGLVDNGGGLSFTAYQEIISATFTNLNLGYIKIFSSPKKNRIFIQSDLAYDMRIDGLRFAKGGLSTKNKIGVAFTDTELMKFIIGVYYRTAITDYFPSGLGEPSFKPYSIGIELGFIAF